MVKFLFSEPQQTDGHFAFLGRPMHLLFAASKVTSAASMSESRHREQRPSFMGLGRACRATRLRKWRGDIDSCLALFSKVSNRSENWDISGFMNNLALGGFENVRYGRIMQTIAHRMYPEELINPLH